MNGDEKKKRGREEARKNSVKSVVGGRITYPSAQFAHIKAADNDISQLNGGEYIRREWKAWSWGSDTRDTFKIVFYPCHDKPGVSITPGDKWYDKLYIYIYKTHDTINFCRIIRGWKTLWPSRHLSFLLFSSPVIHISLHIHPLRASTGPPVYTHVHRITPGKSLYRW